MYDYCTWGNYQELNPCLFVNYVVSNGIISFFKLVLSERFFGFVIIPHKVFMFNNNYIVLNIILLVMSMPNKIANM